LEWLLLFTVASYLVDEVQASNVQSAGMDCRDMFDTTALSLSIGCSIGRLNVHACQLGLQAPTLCAAGRCDKGSRGSSGRLDDMVASPTVGGRVDPLLEEYKNNRTRRWEMRVSSADLMTALACV